jgi:hypothetical protein
MDHFECELEHIDYMPHESLLPSRVGIAGRNIMLYVQFSDAYGDPINTDSIPQVAIYDSHGTLQQMSTNIGVGFVQEPGIYSFNYLIPLDGYDGYFSDLWTAQIGGDTVTA